ncbi:ribonuclease Z [Balneicella halophila]|uniref:Ribonuclease Z n=1 Tax=Balneicella halophila TaxID=1537566 RepID=A0A7L4URP4_BALHA|nr:ribonuclease Z [Balneicella halophila]PVX52423.1 ribonuclease Z [Balneicella halophila]
MQFELTILGCNSALPTAYRYQTAQVLNVSERFFLIDCGEGTQIQLRRFKTSLQKINYVFISHMHGDHFIGLPGLISSMALLGRTRPLHIFGPRALKEYLDYHTKLFGGRMEFVIDFHLNNPSKKELIFEDKVVEVYSFPLYHGSIPTSGFLFREKRRLANLIKEKLQEYKIPVSQMHRIREGADFINDKGEVVPNEELTIPAPTPRSYAFCSDTSYDERLVPIVKEVDLLYHEATFSEKERELAAKRFHSTAKQAARIALKANVGKLLIGHYSARYPDTTILQEQAQEVFKNTLAVEDGTKINIPLKNREQWRQS